MDKMDTAVLQGSLSQTVGLFRQDTIQALYLDRVPTGFPRLDGWHHIQVNPRQIVLMPTWRLYLAQNPNTVFEETAYFRAYRDLINSPELSNLLIEKDLKLVFYLHHNMRKYVDSFHTDCPNIEVVYRDDTYDIQELLKESALLITDYSSVHFDFAYMASRCCTISLTGRNSGKSSISKVALTRRKTVLAQ